MEAITYNGIALQVLTGFVNREDDRSDDGVDVFWQKWTIEALCYFGPRATSYVLPGAAPVASVNQLAGVTDNAIRDSLMTPRAQLVVAAGGVEILRQPANGQTTDANNGPLPEECRVKRMFGTKVWQVYFRITTWVPFATAKGKKAPLLVSNRWGQFVDIDENRRAVRVTEGVAKFRADQLRQATLTADSFRPTFAGFSVPQNFQRVGVNVQALSDGNTVHYRVTDRENYLNLGSNSIATEIDGAVTGYVTTPGPAKIASDQGWTGLGLRSAWLGFAAGFLGGGMTEEPMTKFIMQPMVQPTYFVNAHVRVVGDRNANRAALLRLAIAIASNRVGGLLLFSASQSEIRLMYSLKDPYVEVDLSHTWNNSTRFGDITFIADALVPTIIQNYIVTAATNLAGGENGAIGNLMKAMGNTPDLKVRQLGLVGSPTNLTTNPPFASSGTRGSWLENLVTQALYGPTAGPTAVP